MNKVWPISAYKPSFVRTHQPLHRGRYVIYQTPLADDPVPSYSSAFASLYWFNKELRERKRFLRMLKVPSKTTKAWPHYFFGQIFITAVNLSSTWIMQRALNSHLFLIELLVYPQTPHSEGWSQGQAVWCQLYAKVELPLNTHNSTVCVTLTQSTFDIRVTNDTTHAQGSSYSTTSADAKVDLCFARLKTFLFGARILR